MTAKEKQEVLARLAAGDVASLMAPDIESSTMQDEFAATMRVVKVLNVPAQQANGVYQKMIEKLKDADLTINIRAANFFHIARSGKYLNAYEIGQDGGYMTVRDTAEEKLFNYSNINGKTNLKANVQGAVNRVKQLGSYSGGSNLTFEPGVRPKYAALNFAGLTNGPASMYGSSYMVLKEHLKHNCTFSDRDSFSYRNNANAAGLVANYLHLHRLILNMADNKLKALYNAATGGTIPGARLGASDYIEAQVHAGIMVNRDIQKIFICNAEIGGPDGRQLRDLFTRFTQKFSIRLEYI
jgi:hypothetical protein